MTGWSSRLDHRRPWPGNPGVTDLFLAPLALPGSRRQVSVPADVALYLLKRHSGIVWGPGRFAGLPHGLWTDFIPRCRWASDQHSPSLAASCPASPAPCRCCEGAGGRATRTALRTASNWSCAPRILPPRSREGDLEGRSHGGGQPCKQAKTARPTGEELGRKRRSA